jgi:hypothetical protein
MMFRMPKATIDCEERTHMSITKEIHECECEDCQRQEEKEHPNRAAHHQQINVLLSRLDEQQRRWFVALESKRIGHGGVVLLSKITGLDEKTIRRGRREMEAGLTQRPATRVRLPGGGRPPTE